MGRKLLTCLGGRSWALRCDIYGVKVRAHEIRVRAQEIRRERRFVVRGLWGVGRGHCRCISGDSVSQEADSVVRVGGWMRLRVREEHSVRVTLNVPAVRGASQQPGCDHAILA